jgi:hypothetical protein
MSPVEGRLAINLDHRDAQPCQLDDSDDDHDYGNDNRCSGPNRVVERASEQPKDGPRRKAGDESSDDVGENTFPHARRWLGPRHVGPGDHDDRVESSGQCLLCEPHQHAREDEQCGKRRSAHRYVCELGESDAKRQRTDGAYRSAQQSLTSRHAWLARSGVLSADAVLVVAVDPVAARDPDVTARTVVPAVRAEATARGAVGVTTTRLATRRAAAAAAFVETEAGGDIPTEPPRQFRLAEVGCHRAKERAANSCKESVSAEPDAVKASFSGQSSAVGH